MNWRGANFAVGLIEAAGSYAPWVMPVLRVSFTLGLIAVAGIICNGAWRWMQWFPLYAFFDPGWSLTTNQLLSEGMVPTRDFAYTYGLSSLLFTRGVFAVFGATPAVNAGLILAAELIMLLGVWRLARNLELGAVARGLVVLLTPLVLVPGSVPSPTHAIEAALLTHALAFHANRRLGIALALATVAVTFKPALGYIYGFVLVCQILTTPSPYGRNRLRRLVPAILTAATLGAVLVGYFGLGPVLNTQFTTEARKEYVDLRAGFFSALGSPFWKGMFNEDGGVDWRYIAGTEFGVWSACTVALLVGSLLAIRRWKSDPAAPVVVALTVWHLLFVLCFWGNHAAWIYYPYVPFVGGPIVIDRLSRWLGKWSGAAGQVMLAASAAGVALLAVQPTQDYFSRGYNPHSDFTTRSEITGGLFATEREIADWEGIRKLAREDGPVFVLYRMGCAPVLFPELGGPRSWYLSGAIATDAEKERVRKGLAGAKWLVVSTFITHTLPEWVIVAARENGFHMDRARFPNDKLVGDCPVYKSCDENAVFSLYLRCVPGPEPKDGDEK